MGINILNTYILHSCMLCLLKVWIRKTNYVNRSKDNIFCKII